MYHGYENGFWTLGRQPAGADRMDRRRLVPRDRGDLGQPLRKPAGQALSPHGVALSDDFRGSTLGPQWAFFNPAQDEYRRLGFSGNGLVLKGKGSTPRDASPLTTIAGDRAYQFEVEMEIAPVPWAARCCSTATACTWAWAAMASRSSCIATARSALPGRRRARRPAVAAGDQQPPHRHLPLQHRRAHLAEVSGSDGSVRLPSQCSGQVPGAEAGAVCGRRRCGNLPQLRYRALD